jgi:DNA-binding Lrp family transcriptional regulator
MKAYVFVNATTKGDPRAMLKAIRGVSGIKSADMCWGLPDIIAVADVPDAKGLQRVVLDEIQKIPGVNVTDSHIVSEA